METIWLVLQENWPGYIFPVLVILAAELGNVVLFRHLDKKEQP